MMGLAHRIEMEPWDFYIVVPWEMQELLRICNVFMGDHAWARVGKGKAGNQRASVSILVVACEPGFSHCCCDQHKWGTCVGILFPLLSSLHRENLGSGDVWAPGGFCELVEVVRAVTIQCLHCLLWPLMLPDRMMPPWLGRPESLPPDPTYLFGCNGVLQWSRSS